MRRPNPDRRGGRPKDGDIPNAPFPRFAEIAGIGLLVVSLAACFALWSFNPQDTGGDGNLVGPIGAQLARVVLATAGCVGYASCFVLAIFAIGTLVGVFHRPSALEVICSIAIMLSATVLAHLTFASTEVFGYPAGGLLGAGLASLARLMIGVGGTGLVAVGVFVAAVLGLTKMSLTSASQDLLRLFSGVGNNVTGRAKVWHDARMAADLRKKEVLEAERVRREEERRAAEERERRIRDDLEEKKRIAVLKATARAEEKALAEIAKQDAKRKAILEQEQRDAEEAALVSSADFIDQLDSRGRPISEADEDEEEDEEDPRREAGESTYALDEEEAAEDEEEGDEADDEEYDEEEGDEDEEYDEEAEDEEEEEEEEEETDDEDDEDDAEVGGPKIRERKDAETELTSLVGPAPLLGIDPARDAAPKPETRNYQMPPLHLLDYEGKAIVPTDEGKLRAKAQKLEDTLRTYHVDGIVTAIQPGPVVTTYEYQPAPGVKVSKIAGLSDDIALSMKATRVRIVAPIPGRGVVGIELPNDTRESVYLKEVIAHDAFRGSSSLLSLALGKDAEGVPRSVDLRQMPHLLIAGTTGSGKSVSINTMVLSILYKATPDQVKFIMVDPKMLELSLYADIPHLLLPVVTDPKKASVALQWAVDEMARRYQLLSDYKVRDIDGFNKKVAALRSQRAKDGEHRAEEPNDAAVEGEESVELEAAASEPPKQLAFDTSGSKRIQDPAPTADVPNALPYIVVLIDEFADLMLVAPRDVETSVQRLAQKARAAGIHLMLATQRPSTDVITGVIKNNFPCRISFRVASPHDSQTILNMRGAESLLGMGDMLFLGNTSSPTRIHGAFVSEEEVGRVVEFWKAQAKPRYDQTILRPREGDEDGFEEDQEQDEMYDKAVQIVTETRKASISAVQRRLRVGYNRAARMIEMMEKEGIVGAAVGPKGEREVYAQEIRS